MNDYTENENKYRLLMIKLVFPLLDSASIMYSECMEKMSKLPFYKFGFKHTAIDLKKSININITSCENVCNKDITEEVIARIEDVIYPDILEIRNFLSKKLNVNNYKYAPVYSRLDTASIIYQLAIKAFDSISRIHQDKTGFSYRRDYLFFRPDILLKGINKLEEMLYDLGKDDVNINLNSKEGMKLVDKLYKDLYETDLINKVTEEVINEQK